MVESTMIMKKPIIIAHSGFQGFCDCGELRVKKSQRLAARAGPDPARPVPPGVRGVAVVIHPTSFRFPTMLFSRIGPAGRPAQPTQVIHHARGAVNSMKTGERHGPLADIQPDYSR
ncbi:hypothetical protein MUNTM_57540 [Mycobacterium sp. MUNTM1]